MPGRAQYFGGRADFHQDAGLHYRDPIGDLGDHAKVVGDEDDAVAVHVAQPPDQGQDLRLGGDVQRRGRLVGDQDLGVQRQGHGDADPLALAAR